MGGPAGGDQQGGAGTGAGVRQAKGSDSMEGTYLAASRIMVYWSEDRTYSSPAKMEFLVKEEEQI